MVASTTNLKPELSTPAGLPAWLAQAAAQARYLGGHFRKPEYLFRPQQLWLRLRRAWAATSAEEQVTLPWGATIRVQPGEVVGRAIWHAGCCDLAVSETLWRLIDRGETAVDVGANIGAMTALMAARVGPKGKVIAFEPHPEIFRRLRKNIELWQGEADAPTRAYRVALSDYCGGGQLSLPCDFQRNHGLAALAEGKTESRTIPVLVQRLDDLIHDCVGVLKLDIEGHEFRALQGATGLLCARQIRDFVFEEHRTYPTPVTRLLEAHGYTLFNLGQCLWGLKLTPVAGVSHHRPWDSRSCLATLDPERALQRLQPRGWRLLRGRAV